MRGEPSSSLTMVGPEISDILEWAFEELEMMEARLSHAIGLAMEGRPL